MAKSLYKEQWTTKPFSSTNWKSRQRFVTLLNLDIAVCFLFIMNGSHSVKNNRCRCTHRNKVLRVLWNACNVESLSNCWPGWWWFEQHSRCGCECDRYSRHCTILPQSAIYDRSFRGCCGGELSHSPRRSCDIYIAEPALQNILSTVIQFNCFVATQGYSILQVTAIDGDRGLPNPVKYTFKDGRWNVWSIFMIIVQTSQCDPCSWSCLHRSFWLLPSEF